jgi:hypothetical protein
MSYFQAFCISIFLHVLLYAGGVLFQEPEPTSTHTITHAPMTIDVCFSNTPSHEAQRDLKNTIVNKKNITTNLCEQNCPQEKELPPKTHSPVLPENNDLPPTNTQQNISPDPNNTPLSFPKELTTRHQHIKLVATLTISPKGDVTNVKIMSFDDVSPILKKHIVKTLSQWHFTVPLKIKTEIHMDIPIEFICEAN